MSRFPWFRRASDDDAENSVGEENEVGPSNGAAEPSPENEAARPASGDDVTEGETAGDTNASPDADADARSDSGAEEAFLAEYDEAEPIVSCKFQDGTLYVYQDMIHIERRKGSRFTDKWIALTEIHEVTVRKRLFINFLQLEQAGFETGSGGFITTPVDENTLHFGRGKRDCAERAADEIRKRVGIA